MTLGRFFVRGCAVALAVAVMLGAAACGGQATTTTSVPVVITEITTTTEMPVTTTTEAATTTTEPPTTTSLSTTTTESPAPLPPTITGLSANRGSTAGGDEIVISGTNFVGLAATDAVTFGGTGAPAYSVDSATQIIVTVPAHAAGKVQVKVKTAGGTTANTPADDYTYVAAPAITSLSPTSGPLAGGTKVVITGSSFVGLSGAAAVTFGGTSATAYTVDSATKITATAPAHAAGAVRVQVSALGGVSANTAADDYTYVAVPTITSLDPTSGPTGGGTTVVIKGTGFIGLNGAAAVTFGGANATSYTVDSATKITAVAPAHAAGTVRVKVTAAGGATADKATDDYTYVSPPAITSLSPASGPSTGGAIVVINGTGFAGLIGAAAVTFDGTNATSYTVDSATKITATPPAHASGVVRVKVTTPYGSSADTSADDYTYLPVPAVSSLSVTSGPLAGGTTVVITGTEFIGLSGPAAVTFGGADAAGYTVDSGTQITATSPAHAAGTVQVRVGNDNGQSADTPADDFTYVPPPVITSLGPASGPTAGGNVVVISGADLQGATVTFDGVPAEPAEESSKRTATSIQVRAPAHAAGTVRVQVTTAYGSSDDTAADDYTYVAPPTVSLLSIAAGPLEGGAIVVITGTDFTGLSGTSAVEFGDIDATEYTVDSATQITATAPAHEAGAVQVKVTTPYGSSADTPADDFAYVEPPAITLLEPTTGPPLGGNEVVITGERFVGVTMVLFGELPAEFVVDSDLQITAVAPAAAEGMVRVQVVAAGGVTLDTPLDDYSYSLAGESSATLTGPAAQSTAGVWNRVVALVEGFLKAIR